MCVCVVQDEYACAIISVYHKNNLYAPSIGIFTDSRTIAQRKSIVFHSKLPISKLMFF